MKSAGFQQVSRLYRSEMRLFRRDAQVLIFVFGFPIVMVLVLGGVFGTATDDSGFEFVNPSHWYVAAYFGVMQSAIGLIMLPAHIAAYREQGVLRRFDAAGFASWVFPTTQVLCGVTFAALGSITLLITAALSSGVPAMQDPLPTLVGLVVGTLTFVSIGVALGMMLPSSRAAAGLGLTLFLPMFLLGGGGPPQPVLSETMRSISDWLPLTHVIRSYQEPWVDIGDGEPHLLIVVAMLVVSAALWIGRSRRVARTA